MRFSLPSINFSAASQLPTTAERAVIKSLCTVQTTKRYSSVVVTELGRPAEYLADGSEKRICGLIFEVKIPDVIEKRSKSAKLNQL